MIHDHQNALPPRKSFTHPDYPKFQTAWDSTSIGVAKKCARKYQLSIIEGWQPKADSHHLRYGILYHRAGEVYDHAIASGQDHEAALRTALWDLAKGCQDEVEVKVPEDQIAEVGDMVVLRKQWWNPSQHLSEDKAKSNTKTIPNLFRTVVWYLEQFGPNDVAKTIILDNGKPAVEVSFRFDAGFEVLGHPIMLSGHFDKLAEFHGEPYVFDKKTTAGTIDGKSSRQYFAQYSPNNQMTIYTIASRVALSVPAKGVIIDAAQIAQGFSRFERGFANRTNAQLEEWMDDFRSLVTMFAAYARQDYWPMNDTACSDYGGCAFRDICNRDPSVRRAFLQSNFTKRYWDPLEVRGDI